MRRRRQAFTLLEIIILVAIIGILVAIAFPHYVKYTEGARASACISNMKKIESAVMMAKVAGKNVPEAKDIVGGTSYLKEMPRCPSNKAAYTAIDPPECPAGEASHVIN